MLVLIKLALNIDKWLYKFPAKKMQLNILIMPVWVNLNKNLVIIGDGIEKLASWFSKRDQ